MRYQTPSALRDALEDRLRRNSRETGIPLIRLRKAVVFDRLLARLLQLGPDRWVLKGALALDFRFGSAARTTMDMDVEHSLSSEKASEDLIQIQSVDLGDHFSFAITRTSDGRDGPVRSVSYLARAELAGRVFEEVVIDVGSSEHFTDDVEHELGSKLLEFAGIDPILIPMISIEQHIAEKVHAYTRIYGDGLPSSRVKDLVDLVLIKMLGIPNAAKLRDLLEKVFAFRDLQALPDYLPDPPGDWKSPYKVLAQQVGIEPDLTLGHTHAAKMVDPILSNIAKGEWDPAKEQWLAD